MDRKAQTSIEYLMLLGGILLVVVLVILILRGNVITSAQNTINANYNNYVGVTNVSNCSLSGC